MNILNVLSNKTIVIECTGYADVERVYCALCATAQQPMDLSPYETYEGSETHFHVLCLTMLQISRIFIYNEKQCWACIFVSLLATFQAHRLDYPSNVGSRTRLGEERDSSVPDSMRIISLRCFRTDLSASHLRNHGWVLLVRVHVSL